MRDQVEKPSNISPINTSLLNTFQEGGQFCQGGETTKNPKPKLNSTQKKHSSPPPFAFFLLLHPEPNSRRSNHLLLPLKSKASSLSSLHPHLLSLYPIFPLLAKRALESTKQIHRSPHFLSSSSPRRPIPLKRNKLESTSSSLLSLPARQRRSFPSWRQRNQRPSLSQSPSTGRTASNGHQQQHPTAVTTDRGKTSQRHAHKPRSVRSST